MIKVSFTTLRIQEEDRDEGKRKVGWEQIG
jgi:hypothetical protein